MFQNLFFKNTIPYRYILDIVLYHTKNDFVIKKVLDVQKMSYLSKHGL